MINVMGTHDGRERETVSATIADVGYAVRSAVSKGETSAKDVISEANSIIQHAIAMLIQAYAQTVAQDFADESEDDESEADRSERMYDHAHESADQSEYVIYAKYHGPIAMLANDDDQSEAVDVSGDTGKHADILAFVVVKRFVFQAIEELEGEENKHARREKLRQEYDDQAAAIADDGEG